LYMWVCVLTMCQNWFWAANIYYSSRSYTCIITVAAGTISHLIDK
jgi:hypothetical protein